MQSVVCPDPTSRAQTHSERPAVTSVFEIAGRFLLFESSSARLPGLVEVLAGFYLMPRDPQPVLADATISFQVGDFPSVIPAGYNRFEVSDGGFGYTDGRLCLFDFKDWRVVARPDHSNRIDVLMRKELDVRRSDHLQVLNYAISAALRRCALYELHSGALVEPRNQRGVLFVGPSGSGKSTLTLQLAESGWQYLTDDVLLLKQTGEVVDAYPLRRAFAVTETTVLASGTDLREAFARTSWRPDSKKRFLPGNFFPGAFAATCRPRAIFFPTITEGVRTVTKKLTHSETMIQLIKLCPWASYDPVTSAEHLKALGTLAKQCTAFHLFAGRDLLRDSSRAANLVLAHLDSVTE